MHEAVTPYGAEAKQLVKAHVRMTTGKKPESSDTQGAAFLKRLVARMTASSPGFAITPVHLAVLAILTIVVVGLGTLWAVVSRPRMPPFDTQLRQALQALDAGDFQTARRIAEALRIADADFRQLGGPVFVQAAALRHDAEDHWNPTEKRKLYLIASRYFEEARDRGWPEGREAQGWLYLAETMVRGGRYAESLPALAEAFKLNPSQRTQIHRLYAEAYYHDRPPHYHDALKHIQQYLTDTQLRPVDRAAGQLFLGRLLIALNQGQEALNALEPLLEKRSQPADEESGPEQTKWERTQLATIRRDATILQAMIWLQQADRTNPGDSSAYKRIREVLESLGQQNIETADSEYLLAQVYQRLGESELHRERLIRVARRFYGTPHGRAAAVELAELYQQRGDYSQAADAVLAAVQGAAESADVAEGVPKWEELKPRLVRLYEKALESEYFQDAARMATALPSLLPEPRVLQLRAQAAVGWAEAQLRQASTSSYSEAQKYRHQAALHFQEAGRLYEELAKIRFADRQFTEDLWKAAEYQFQGRNYASAAALLERYLREEPRLRRPRALLRLGEAFLALGQVPEALHQFEYCYAAYRNDPDSYRARYRAAQALLELGKLADAQQELLAVLESDVLTPQSAEWRDSLFLLGEVLHRQGVLLTADIRPAHAVAPIDDPFRKKAEQVLEQAATYFEQSVARLTEAVKRYPDDSRAWLARYWIAEDYRHLALLPAWKLPTEVIQSRRAELTQRVRKSYQLAFEQYDYLVRWLDQQQDQRELTPVEKAVQRNAYFCRAHTLFDLGDYRAAIDAYSTASNRYQNEPVCLEAYQQIAACYRILGEPNKARGTLEQAKIVMNTLPANVDYSRTTRYPREVWLKVLK